MYEPNSYVEKKLEPREKVNEGTVKDDEIISVEEGTLGKLIKNWDAYVAGSQGEPDPNQAAIEVKSVLGARMTISLPKTKEYHPKSNFGKWAKRYKSPPQVGQKVKVIANENGFFNFLL